MSTAPCGMFDITNVPVSSDTIVDGIASDSDVNRGPRNDATTRIDDAAANLPAASRRSATGAWPALSTAAAVAPQLRPRLDSSTAAPRRDGEAPGCRSRCRRWRAREYCSGTNTSHSHDADRHVHLRQRHLDVAFLLERRAGMHVDERHGVGMLVGNPARISGMRVPSAPVAGLRALAGQIDRHDRRTRRQLDLEERLRCDCASRVALPSARVPRS